MIPAKLTKSFYYRKSMAAYEYVKIKGGSQVVLPSKYFTWKFSRTFQFFQLEIKRADKSLEFKHTLSFF